MPRDPPTKSTASRARRHAADKAPFLASDVAGAVDAGDGWRRALAAGEAAPSRPRSGICFGWQCPGTERMNRETIDGRAGSRIHGASCRTRRAGIVPRASNGHPDPRQKRQLDHADAFESFVAGRNAEQAKASFGWICFDGSFDATSRSRHNDRLGGDVRARSHSVLAGHAPWQVGGETVGSS